MVATVRALTGRAPMALFGDSADPARPRVRSLAEEAARVVRTRVLNPKWIQAMTRHGYKGAAELSAAEAGTVRARPAASAAAAPVILVPNVRPAMRAPTYQTARCGGPRR